jgi:hypothetical protein
MPRRTPEELARVNGRYAERMKWPVMTFDQFCKRFRVSTTADNADRLYRCFEDGRSEQRNAAD